MIKVPNKRESDKHKSEEGWALILLRYLNNKGCDYVIGDKHSPDGFSDVDVFARSISGKYPPLYIQVCLDVNPKDPGFEKAVGAKIFKNLGQTVEAVRGKVEKYEKQKKDFSQITLLIQSYYLIKDDEIYRVPKLREECKDYGFKEIYLVSPRCQSYSSEKQIREAPELVFRIS